MLRDKKKYDNEIQSLTKRQLAQLDNVRADLKVSLIAAWTGSSRAHAVKSMCIECQGNKYRHEITECSSELCPLWRFRPFQNVEWRLPQSFIKPEVKSSNS